MPGTIRLNPSIFEDKRDALAVCWDEALRLFMEDTGFEPEFEVTPEQLKFFRGTAYGDDPDAMKKTIVARIATFDTSVSNPTPEQVSETIRLLDSAIEVFDGQPDGETLKAMKAELESTYKDTNSPVTQSATQAPNGNILAENARESGEVPAQEQAAMDPNGAVGQEHESNSPKEVQSAMDGGDVMPAAVADYIATAPQPALDYSREAQVRSVVDPILDALAIVESDKNPDAIGDRGKAVGMFQAWPIAVDEANRIIGREKNPLWTYKDRRNPQQARAMAKATLDFHYKRGVTDPVKLGGKWRDPYGKVARREQLEGKTDQKVYERKLRSVLEYLKNK